jgi:hypothetical protein
LIGSEDGLLGLVHGQVLSVLYMSPLSWCLKAGSSVTDVTSCKLKR